MGRTLHGAEVRAVSVGVTCHFLQGRQPQTPQPKSGAYILVDRDGVIIGSHSEACLAIINSIDPQGLPSRVGGGRCSAEENRGKEFHVGATYRRGLLTGEAKPLL